MASPTLLPDPVSLHLVHLETAEQSLLVVVETTSQEAVCPLCHCHCEQVLFATKFGSYPTLVKQ
jgi:hypothetical protein